MTGPNGSDPFNPVTPIPGPELDKLLPPELAALPEAPPEPVGPDEGPKRPTTRAGRRAAAEAARIKKEKEKESGKADKKPAAKPTPRRASLESRLVQNLTGLGTVVAATGGMVAPAFAADGIVIVQNAEAVGKALARVAQDNPAVAASLEKMLTAGVWSGLIAAMLPVMVGIAGNHGMIPAAMLGQMAELVEDPAGG